MRITRGIRKTTKIKITYNFTIFSLILAYQYVYPEQGYRKSKNASPRYSTSFCYARAENYWYAATVPC